MMVPREMSLRKGDVLRVTGAAKITVVDGCMYALGCEMRDGETLVVVSGRVVCCEALEDSKLKYLLGSGGSLSLAKPSEEVIGEWREKAREAIREGGVVVVLGEVDSGKSTYSTVLLNTAANMEMKAAFVDEDLGQKDLGPPGTVALGFADKPVYWLRDIPVSALEFVGSTTPLGYEAPVISATLKLVERGRADSDIVVVNTDGWVDDGRALNFKVSLVKALSPTRVVVMQGEGNSTVLSKALSQLGFRVLEIPSPPARLRKTRSMRKTYREMAMTSFLLGSRRLKIDGRRAPLVNPPLFLGKRREDFEGKLRELLRIGELRVEVLGSLAVIATRKPSEAARIKRVARQVAGIMGVNRVMVIPVEELVNAYVGLYGEDGNTLTCGVVRRIDLEGGYLYVDAPLKDPSSVRCMALGRMKVGVDGREGGVIDIF